MYFLGCGKNEKLSIAEPTRYSFQTLKWKLGRAGTAAASLSTGRSRRVEWHTGPAGAGRQPTLGAIGREAE